MALTFKDYIVGPGDTQGALNAAKNLNIARNKILKQVTGKQITINCQELEDQLNALFYPSSQDTEALSLHNKFNSFIAKLYEQETDKKLMGFDISDAEYYTYSGGFTENFDYSKFQQERTNMTVRVALREFNIVQDYIKNIEKDINNNSSAAIEKFNKLKEEINTIQQNLISYAEDFVKNSGDATASNMLISQAFGTRGKGLNQQITQLHAIFKALTTLDGQAKVTPYDYGLIFEMAITRFKQFLIAGGRKIENELLKEAIKSIGYGKRVAQKNVTRNGITVDMQLINPNDLISLTEIGTDKSGEQFAKTYNINGTNIKISYQGSNKIDKAQGKMDVQMEYTDNTGQTNILQESLKNWKNSGGHNFGNTSILDGLSRSLSQVSVLESYAMTLQHPKVNSSGEKYSNAIANLTAAHNLAKVALKADIMMGISQKSNYANIAIVHIRGKKIKVFDMVKVLKEDSENNGLLQLYHYDETNLENIANAIRNVIFSQSHSSRSLQGYNSKNYYGLMYNYFKGQQVTVKYLGTI